jgi:hypothetical protein
VIAVVLTVAAVIPTLACPAAAAAAVAAAADHLKVVGVHPSVILVSL